MDDLSQCQSIALAHLDGPERLQRLAGARHKEVVDLQQIHAHGKGEDARAAQRRQDDGVGREQQHRQTDAGDGQRCSLPDDAPARGPQRVGG